MILSRDTSARFASFLIHINRPNVITFIYTESTSPSGHCGTQDTLKVYSTVGRPSGPWQHGGNGAKSKSEFKTWVSNA